MNSRRFLVFNLIIALMLFLGFADVYSQVSNEKVLVVNMEATIDAGASDLLTRAVSSPPTGTKAIIILLNTNGGYLQATESIVDTIIRSPVKIIVYVPPGGRAFSAGAYIAISSNTLAMSIGSVIGSAEPRNIGGVESDPKIVNAMASWMASLAKLRERNETAAQNMVLENADYTAEEGYEVGLVDHVVESLDDLFEIEGLSGVTIINIGMDVRTRILSILSDPFVVGILIDIAALLILIEVFHPTFLGGIGAAVGFILALLGLGLIGADATALIILLIGVLSILMEIKIGHGGPAVVGSLLIALGTLLLYRKEYFIWTFNYTTLVAGGLALIVVITGIIGLYLHKIREVLLKKKSVLDLNMLIGKEGVVKSRITPNKPGVVFAASDLWTAFSDEVIEEGEKVEIIGVDGLRIKVKKVK